MTLGNIKYKRNLRKKIIHLLKIEYQSYGEIKRLIKSEVSILRHLYNFHRKYEVYFWHKIAQTQNKEFFLSKSFFIYYLSKKIKANLDVKKEKNLLHD